MLSPDEAELASYGQCHTVSYQPGERNRQGAFQVPTNRWAGAKARRSAPNPNPNPSPIPSPNPTCPTPNQACSDDTEAEATLFWRNRQPVLLRLLARAPGQF